MSEPPAADRPELRRASMLRDQGCLWTLTPYWRVGSLLVCSRPGRWAWRRLAPAARHRQAPVWVGATAVFGLPLWIVFVVWMVLRISEEAPPQLQWRMWVAGLWLIASPGLIIGWERRFHATHDVICTTAPEDGWQRDRLLSIDRAFGMRWWVCAGGTGLALALGFLLSRTYLRDNLGLAGPSDPYFWTGLLAVATLGASFGMGIWGVAKTLVYARAALDRPIPWNPFLGRQLDGVESLLSFSYWTGILYSLGCVFLPVLYTIIGEVTAPARVIGVAVTAALIFGGAAAFTLPTLWMSRIAQQQRIEVLQRYAQTLTALESACLAEDDATDHEALSSRVNTIIALRSVVAAERPIPSAVGLAARVFALFLLPILISLAQTFADLR